MEGSRREGCLVQLLVHGWFGEQPQRKAQGDGNRCAEAGGYEETHRDDAAKKRSISPLKPSVVAARRQSLLLP